MLRNLPTRDLEAMLASLRSSPARNVPFYLSQVSKITDELERRKR